MPMCKADVAVLGHILRLKNNGLTSWILSLRNFIK